jgi:hypothetical protein
MLNEMEQNVTSLSLSLSLSRSSQSAKSHTDTHTHTQAFTKFSSLYSATELSLDRPLRIILKMLLLNNAKVDKAEIHLHRIRDQDKKAIYKVLSQKQEETKCNFFLLLFLLSLRYLSLHPGHSQPKSHSFCDQSKRHIKPLVDPPSSSSSSFIYLTNKSNLQRWWYTNENNRTVLSILLYTYTL